MISDQSNHMSHFGFKMAHHSNDIAFSKEFQSNIAARLQIQMLDEPGDFTNNRSLINVLDSIVEATAISRETEDDDIISFTPSKNNENDRLEKELTDRIKKLQAQLQQQQSKIVDLKSSLAVTKQLDPSKYNGTHTFFISVNPTKTH